MHTVIKSGAVHFFTAANGAHLPIWEKEAGVFVTVDEKKPVEVFLRDSLKQLDSYIKDFKMNIAKARLLKGFLDIQAGGDSLGEAGIQYLQQGEDGGLEDIGADKIKQIKSMMAEMEERGQKLELNRIEFLEFMNLCGVNENETDNAANEAESLLKKLSGGDAPKAAE